MWVEDIPKYAYSSSMITILIFVLSCHHASKIKGLNLTDDWLWRVFAPFWNKHLFSPNNVTNTNVILHVSVSCFDEFQEERLLLTNFKKHISICFIRACRFCNPIISLGLSDNKNNDHVYWLSATHPHFQYFVQYIIYISVSDLVVNGPQYQDQV